jgi:ribonuclease R
MLLRSIPNLLSLFTILIHITSLPKDYYQYEEDHHRLVGEKTRKIFRLGDNLKVKVIRVELNERKIDFELIEKNKDTDTKISTSSFDRKVKNKRKKIENKIKTKK